MQRVLLVLTLLLASCCLPLHAQVGLSSTYVVQGGSDDAEEKINSGAMDIGSSDLELVQESSEQLIGIRFVGIQIPRGATINSAFIQFTVDETDDVLTNLIFEGELTADAQPYSPNAFDISSRTRTATSVNWDSVPAWTETNVAGPDQRTPDLSAILNELISQDGWEPGNALAFIISGSGKRTAISQNKGDDFPPRLIINYDTPDFPVESFPFAANSIWRYNDEGVALDTAGWTTLAYNDSTWAFGNAKFGYGDDNESTTLDFGPDANTKYPTYYFRKVFTVEDPGMIDSLTISLLRDDGAVVYLNGEEIIRSNMPDGEITYNTLASDAFGGADEDRFFDFKVPSNLQAGENIIAVEVHQGSLSSSDLGFDLAVTPEITLPPAIQLIHNSPDPSLAFVSIYVDAFSLGNFVNFTGDTPVPFRAATEYVNDLPAGTHQIAISPFGQEDFAWSATTITLEDNKRYIAIASGVREPALFDTIVNAPEDLAFQIQIAEVPFDEEVSDGEAFLLLEHGTPDLPNIRLIAPGVGDATADLPTGLPLNFPLLGGEVPAFNFPLVQVTNNDADEIFGAYSLQLQAFSGQVVTIVTSGFFTSENNTGVANPNFGTFFIPSAGGFFLPLAEPLPPIDGTMEVIHDSPDPQLAEVDVYLNGALAAEGLGFRESTGRFDIPAGVNRLAIAPAGTVDTAWSARDILIDFDLNSATLRLEGFDYSAAAFGVRDTASFNNETNSDVSFDVAQTQARTEATDTNTVDIIFFHGGIDAPTIDLILDGQFIPLVNNLAFGDFSPIYASLPANDMFQLNITAADDNQQIVKAYLLDLSGLGGEVLTITASGLLNGDPAFGLFSANGTSADLIALTEVVVNNVDELQRLGIQLYPNPVADQLRIDGPAQRIQLMDLNGRLLQQLIPAVEGNTLSLGTYPAGTYLLRIEHEQGVSTAKVIKR